METTKEMTLQERLRAEAETALDCWQVLECDPRDVVGLFALLDEAERVVERLANEVGGLCAFGDAVAEAIGNTNYAVLMLRQQEADAFLAKLRKEQPNGND